jgi:predicted CopG family antitoxin
METTQNTKTIYLDFTYEEGTIEEALGNFRKECSSFADVVINLYEERTQYSWPVIECIVPEDKADEFALAYFGGDSEQARFSLDLEDED